MVKKPQHLKGCAWGHQLGVRVGAPLQERVAGNRHCVALLSNCMRMVGGGWRCRVAATDAAGAGSNCCFRRVTVCGRLRQRHRCVGSSSQDRSSGGRCYRQQDNRHTVVDRLQQAPLCGKLQSLILQNNRHTKLVAACCTLEWWPPAAAACVAVWQWECCVTRWLRVQPVGL